MPENEATAVSANNQNSDGAPPLYRAIRITRVDDIESVLNAEFGHGSMYKLRNLFPVGTDGSLWVAIGALALIGPMTTTVSPNPLRSPAFPPGRMGYSAIGDAGRASADSPNPPGIPLSEAAAGRPLSSADH